MICHVAVGFPGGWVFPFPHTPFGPGALTAFARDQEERSRAGNPRLSIAERYSGYAEYERRYREATADLVRRRYLLAEDVPRLQKLCRQFENLFSE